MLFEEEIDQLKIATKIDTFLNVKSVKKKVEE